MFKRIVTSVLAKADITIGGKRPGDIYVLHPRFYRRVALMGSLGFGDSYADGDVTCDLEAFFEKWMRYGEACRLAALKRSPFAAHRIDLPKSLPDLAIRARRLFGNQQSILRSKRVGKRHYDIGNDLYRAMLGPTMAYSCGYWSGAKTLDQAQRNKYRIICEKLGFKPGMRVLEIGCGWGGFASFAAREYSVNVVGVSISEEQIKYARFEYADLFESGAIDLRFMDYREIPGEFKAEFDAVVSIGMFEHVGPDNYDEYMRVAWLALKPGGMFLLHTIVGSGGVDPFIEYRIFPGGMLPTEEQIARAAKPYFAMEHMENFGFDYSRTLSAWGKNFRMARMLGLANAGYDERFARMWEFYLKGCAVSFKTRRIHLQQRVLAKGGVEGGYQWNRPVYQD